MKSNILLTLILVLFICQSASAQRYRKGEGYIAPWEFALSGGVSSFVTSVNPTRGAEHSQINYWKNDLNPAFALSVVRNLTPGFGVEVNWLSSRLTGKWNDNWQPLPYYSDHKSPLTYDTRINQFDLMMVFNINQLMLPGELEDPWHLFLKAGAGITLINDKENYYPNDNPYTKYSAALDGGISVSVSEQIKLMIGTTFRVVNTDNLDGVHLFSAEQDGKRVAYLNTIEIYHFTYMRVSYNWGKIKF